MRFEKTLATAPKSCCFVFMPPFLQQLLGPSLLLGLCGLAAAQQPDYQKLFDDHYLPQITEILKRGEYRTAELACDEALRRGQTNPKWQTLRLTAIREQGRIKDVAKELPTLVDRHSEDLEFLVAAHDLYSSVGLREQAAEALTNFNEAALKKPLKDRTAEELVAMGKAAYALGADPNKVLDEFYAAAKKKDPKLVAAYLAAGDLALEKYDYSRASKEYKAGLKQSAQDPDLRFGLARSFFPGDREEAIANADRVLSLNAKHVGAKLMKVEHLINSERYEEAQPLLGSILIVNPNEPQALAFRSVIATVHENDPAAADAAREKALDANAKNPMVPHLIGRSLSRRYRFEDGAQLQRQALEWDPDFTAAKMQLASDSMRLGDEETAWKLAEEVAAADPFNVLAFNYTQLRKQLESYGEVKTDKFRIRMREDEIDIYGDRALAILNEAYDVLCQKYNLQLEDQTLVEFFAEQQDFAIRTFGELGGAGYLGVCFGSVITMNSPASSASGFSNWEATLWHEFCHVVTLTATRNRMPRWLSEGISVYEEAARNPIWGQHMTPDYRSRILVDENVTPVGELSSAFLNAESGEDLMFAYFQSALVVEFLLEEYGQDAFNAILAELATGTPINPSIEKHAEELEPLEAKFSAFVRTRAEAYGDGVDWAKPEEVSPRDLAALTAFLDANPKNFWARQIFTISRLAAEDWQTAAESAQALIDLFPDYIGEQNGYMLLARAHRVMDDTAAEASALRELAKRSADVTPAYQRLLEIDLEAENWEQLLANADRQMAVNPFIKTAHHCKACAAQALGKNDDAIVSYEKLLQLGPTSPADVNFQLARLFRENDGERAKRHLLDSLVDAPRFRDAHNMLIELSAPAPEPKPATPGIPPLPAPSPTPKPNP